MAVPAPAATQRGYGCQREVYHPLSRRAEISALCYYESSDEEDDVGEVGNSPVPASQRKTITAPSTPTVTTLVFHQEPIPTTTVPIPSTGVAAPATHKQPASKNSLASVATTKNSTPAHKSKAVEKRAVFLLDELAAMTIERTAEISSPVSKRLIPPPSTPPRQKRIPFSVLTPENTFGASSPFKTRSTSAEKEAEEEKGKENGEYGCIPGGFDEEVNLHILFEIPQDTGVLFGDNREWLPPLILFICSFAAEMITYYMILFDLHDGWEDRVVCH